MRILVVFDTQSYSAGIVGEVAKLAANTWADITMLGVRPDTGADVPDQELKTTLLRYRREFTSWFNNTESPYGNADDFEEIVSGRCSRYVIPRNREAGLRKQLLLKIRSGDVAREILAEAREQESDLIVLGCTKGLDCQWHGEIDLPQRIARKAPCSTLVIKENKLPKTITCCLDQLHVSQSSLEMIKQIVTLHQAELKIVGLAENLAKAGEEGLVDRIGDILRYYTDQQMNAWIKLVRLEDLENFVAQASRDSMIALWMGKKSLLEKIFSQDLVEKLVAKSLSSVLILR